MRKALLILLATAFTLVAADATGTWSGTMVADGGDGNENPALIVLKQTGDSLTGTAGPNENERHDITGKVVGDKITFETSDPARAMKITFELTLKGDELTGGMAMEREGQKRTAKLNLKRTK